MAKTVFERIFKTAMIVINTVYGILSTVLCFVILTCGSEYTIQQYMVAYLNSAIILGIINWINHGTRKHLKNY